MEKNDLEKIQKIIEKSEKKMIDTIEKSEKKMISILSNEISDLANINRAVITKTDEIDYRLRIVERKLGLAVR